MCFYEPIYNVYLIYNIYIYVSWNISYMTACCSEWKDTSKSTNMRMQFSEDQKVQQACSQCGFRPGV